MDIFSAVREGREETVCSLTRADPTLLEKAEGGSGDTLLLVAVEHGKADMVKLLLKEGAGIDNGGPKGETALMRAITTGNEELVSLLLGHGAKEDLADKSGKTPLMWASIKGHLGLVRLVFEAMLERGSQKGVDQRGKDGKTALHHAAEGGHFEVVAYLLCKEARDSIKDRFGNTPLVLACEMGHLAVIGMLLEAREGQGLQEMGAAGWLGLHYAAVGGHKEIVTFLLSKGAQANTRDEQGSTPLMWACEDGHLDVVQILHGETEGQGLEGRNNYGCTALHDSARGGHKEIVSFLLSKGAEATARDEDDTTPFMCACANGHLEVVQMLFKATEGQGLEDRDNNGFTALHCAAIKGYKDVVAFLLSKGVQASTKDTWQETSLMKACRRGEVGVVQLLLKHTGGQGLSERNSQGKTALHLASSGSGSTSTEVVKVLLLAGADPSITDNQGRTPRQAAEQRRRDRVVEAFAVSYTVPQDAVTLIVHVYRVACD
jgi:ankyrin repeat protein